MNLSNMPPISEHIIRPGNAGLSPDVAQIISLSNIESWKVTKFETTPPMSTYIVAMANGQFEYLESSVVMPLSGKTIPLRIYSKFSSYIQYSILTISQRHPTYIKHIL